MSIVKLLESGFIGQYLITGLREQPFINKDKDENQISYETHLRKILPISQTKCPQGKVCPGAISALGTPWNYYYSHGNWFVDESTFYSILTRVDMDGYTQLEVEEDIEVRTTIWSYAAVDIWCNKIHVGAIATPVYKPIQKKELVFSLKKGINCIYIRLQTLGVRDTRTLFGIQIMEQKEKIRVSLPGGMVARRLIDSGEWLSAAVLKDGILHLLSPAPHGTSLGYDSMSPDYAKVKSRVEYMDITGRQSVILEKGRPYVVLEHLVEGQRLWRRMEDVSQIRPKQLDGFSKQENAEIIFRRTAEVESLSRGDKFGFSISNILARKAIGQVWEQDRDLFLETLCQIEHRYDCSDFLVCGVIRYLKNYQLDEDLSMRVKDVLLNYRYWMDQDGSDAMCFWSENHSLMFYVSAMNAGELYPNDWFPRANMYGQELYEAGKMRVLQWLNDIETYGFEEFLSTVYMCVTFAGLLNTIDYTTDEVSKRAIAVTDSMLNMLALHTFKGSIIAPMGRVYRQIIYPFLQGAQALMNLVNPNIPYSYGEGWLAFYATSSYRLPDGLVSKMEESSCTEYTTGNARIYLEKNNSYCLTSVQSPRTDHGFTRWENLTLGESENVDKRTHEYTKSLNERFHGTTCFEPGTYGYQQHLWSAALDGEAHVFANHPGGTCDSSQMRPGYWYGNGIIPAIRQEKGMLYAVYQIPEEHPIHFTHVFWPGVKFEEMRRENHWLFGKKKNGYVAIWCNKELVLHQDQVFDCEYRSYGDVISYLCICAKTTECNSMDRFVTYCKGQYEEKEGRFPKFVKSGDCTQYV